MLRTKWAFAIVVGAALVTLTLVTERVSAATPEVLSDKTRMQALLCQQWECPRLFMKASGLSTVAKSTPLSKAKKTLLKTQGDAQFFADRVLSVEPVDSPTLLYKKITIRLQPDDVVTSLRLINTRNQKKLDLNNSEASAVRINGRLLISRELKAAHQATQNLIFAGVITPPGNEYRNTTNALQLNQLMLEKIKFSNN